jgi:hypothetical protein
MYRIVVAMSECPFHSWMAFGEAPRCARCLAEGVAADVASALAPGRASRRERAVREATSALL